MSYDANLLIAEDGVLARLAPDATKKFRLATSESGPEEDNVHIPSTGDSKSLKRQQTIQLQDGSTAEEPCLIVEADSPVPKKPRTAGTNKQTKASSAAKKKDSRVREKLRVVSRHIQETHERILYARHAGKYDANHTKKDQDYGQDYLDRCLECSDRQRAFHDVLETIEDVEFRAKLRREVYEWSTKDLVQYADAVDLAYLSVLKKSQAEKAVALKAAKQSASEVAQTTQKKRDAISEEIRRLEKGLVVS